VLAVLARPVVGVGQPGVHPLGVEAAAGEVGVGAVEVLDCPADSASANPGTSGASHPRVRSGLSACVMITTLVRRRRPFIVNSPVAVIRSRSPSNGRQT
jgi:hypothetical protein